MIPILAPVHRWYCPKCGITAETHEARLHVQWHNCPRLGGLAYSMLPEGTKAKVTVAEREDYIGTEKVQLDDNGRPVMSVTTERDDGQDCVVYAPTATARG